MLVGIWCALLCALEPRENISTQKSITIFYIGNVNPDFVEAHTYLKTHLQRIHISDEQLLISDALAASRHANLLATSHRPSFSIKYCRYDICLLYVMNTVPEKHLTSFKFLQIDSIPGRKCILIFCSELHMLSYLCPA